MRQTWSTRVALVIATSVILLSWPCMDAGADKQRPTVTITAPTSSSRFTTNVSPLTISGTASDNVGVTQVTWSNSRGGSGTATGTTSWSASGIALQAGTNTLTVTAGDAAGNTGKATLTVTYDPTLPTVTITSPTTASTFTTNTSPLALGGTAADNVGVTQVTWSNSQGGSGTASGTTSWSASGIALQSGSNVLTVTARDAAGSTATTTLTVTYTGSTGSDTSGPPAAITSPTHHQAVNASTITVAGTASGAGLGNSGISSVTVNGTAASGGTATGSGTASWSQALTLSPGSNTITVVAKDNSPAQNATTVQITVVYDSTAPTVAITSPTTAPTFTATTSPLTLGGTASDTIGVTQVTWSNSQGGSGTASGTTSWSASGIALQSGTNVLTVTARDGAGNTASATVTVTYTPPSGLVAAYAFDEGAGTTSADVSGNGFTATLVSSPSWVAGQFGSALSFNGTSSYAATGLTTNLPNWTVSGWVYSPAGPTSAGYGAPIHREANYQINWNHANPAFQGAAGVRVSGAWYAASFGALAANTWYNLAATYDGETLKAYTNGVLVTSNTTPSGPADADANALTIGRHAAVSEFFQGSVDNVRIYNRALSLTEIQSDMNTPVGTAPSDTAAPTVAITSPTTATTFATNTTPLTLAGTGSDNTAVTQVTWSNSRGGSGTATGTTSWSASGIALPAGTNLLTVTPRDAAGNTGTATLTVTSDPTLPTVTITSPTTASTFTTNTSPLALGGTAADNVGVTQVTWSNSQGGSGTASGTTSWSASGIALQSGSNVLTVTARDAAGNTATTTLTVTYTGSAGSDTTGPAAAITSPTNNQAVNTSPITVAGTASDAGLGNSGISSVTVNGTAASGGTATGSGTASWSQALTLSPGSNTITVVAKDNSPAQNATTVQITVVYDSTAPTVAITSPTTAPTFTATTSPLTLGGTASDTIGVTQVTWSNSQGGSGTASGTTSWSASGIALQSGTNVLTVTARDGAGNTASATVTVTYTPPSGLVAAYAFDEGAGTTSADVSGNGFTATLVSSPSWVAGQFGSALSFNGTSSYAATGLTTNLPNWTVSGWVYSPAGPTSAGYGAPIHREANYQINWNHANPAFQGAAGVRVSGAWYAASFGALAANTWYNLAATYDGETLKAYTNGVLVTSNTTPSGPADADANALTIGRHAAASEFFQGSVDNVRIYNRALSLTEIQSDMNTPVGGTPSSDTTPPTVAITSPTTGATVSGTITVTATASDNVGVVGVRVLVDSGPLGAEVTTPPYSVSWNTLSATDGSHTLSAVARDAAGNLTTSAISVSVSNGGSGGGPSVSGQWSAPFSLPIRDVHMMLFRTGEVLLWDAFDSGHMAYLWNWSTGALTYVPSSDNIFCAGPVLMTDGSALLAGGHASGGVGIPDVNRFDPVTRTWSSLAPMAFQRWYPTTTTLPDGRVLVVSGATTCFTCTGDIPELYNPVTNTWTQLTGAQLSMPLYPHMFVLPDGRVLYASSTEGTIQTQALNVATQTWTIIDPVPFAGGSSAMYRPGVILKSGSPGAPNRIPLATSLNTAYVLDMTQPTPGWQQVGSMAFGRTFHSLTLLPDGSVLATGGSATNDPASQPVYAAEIWNPQTGTWSLMSSMQMARTYHETALLLPDGRVLVGGGGGCCGAPDQFNAEIFSPAYLFKGSRPTITSVASQLAYGSQFFV